MVQKLGFGVFTALLSVWLLGAVDTMDGTSITTATDIDGFTSAIASMDGQAITAGGAVQPIWTTGFEEGACAAELGNPTCSSVTTAGTVDCSSTAWSQDGSQSMLLTSSATSASYYCDNSVTASGEQWVRFWGRFTTLPTIIQYLATTDEGSSFYTISHSSAGAVRVVCPTFVTGTPDISLSVDTDYLFQWHWVSPNGVDIDSGNATLKVYVEGTPPTLIGTSTCTSDDAGAGTSDYYSIYAGANSSNVWAVDCIEIYNQDPGAPTSNACYSP